MDRSCLRGFAAALVLLQALACASRAPSERTVLAGNWARTLLILPLNVPAVMAPELEPARPVVWRELEIYLRGQGKELKTVSFSTARKLWLAAIRKLRAGEKGGRKSGFDDAAREVVIELARHADFEAVIVPSLFVREAPISGRSARWDGVERSVEFEIGRPGPGPASTAPPPVEGLAPAASLHAVVLDREGNKLQEELRGLDLLVAVRVSGSSSEAERSFELATRPDPLANREHVREGIADALAPFLPRPPPGPGGAPAGTRPQ